ncbi:DUF7507 domain-containing protein [Leifsonia sp. McL0607]|uniref:DUF7507 domain-containing protein n=1 Tax=Leifsonia sp. McL0607 TaxID=3415672 RepID=UPI003CF685DD
MKRAERSYHPSKRRRPRRFIASVLAWTIAVAGLAIGATTTTAEPASAAPRLECSEIYGLEGEAPHRVWKLDPNTGSQTAVASFGVSGTLDALGITSDGRKAYGAVNSGTAARVYMYDVEARITSLLGSVPSAMAITHGAVDPRGIFYFGGFSGSVLQIFGFDPEAGQSLGLVASGVVPNTGASGDWVFDSNGALYVLGGTNGSSVISVITQQLPRTPGERISLTGTEITRATTPASEQLSGAAFGSDGYLYVSSESSITRIHPTTGANLGTTRLNSSGMVDMASCVTPNTVEVRVDFVDGRAQPGDQVELSVTGDGVTMGNTQTTAGDAPGLQPQVAGPVLVLPGAIVTLSETGSGADERNYEIHNSCVDRNNNGRDLGVGPGTHRTLAIPTGSKEGVAAVCTFSNRAYKPAIALTKSADRAGLVAGETVTYSFAAKNTGNVTLTDIEVREVAFSGSAAVSAVTCPERTVAPGASVTCAATYVVSQADVDRGSVANTAVVTGLPPVGDAVESAPSTVTLTTSSKPAITLEKTADRAGLVAGDTVTYSFLLANTGNVTLTRVAVHEETFSGAGALSAVSCPDSAGTLAPGASVTCTASYTVSQADLDRGSVTNTATATAAPPSGAAIASRPSSVTLTATTQPGLALTKTADRTELVAGETVSYSFSMTNTGNVTLKDVKPQEVAFSGAGPLSAVSCPADVKTLAPAAAATCAATYVVTQADVDRGSLDNTATATGTPPSGAPVVSAPSTATVTVAQQPAIGLTGAVTPQSGSHADEEVVYSFTVRNTGNVTLTDVALNPQAFSGSGEPGPITCAPGLDSLAPGKDVGCTIEYRLAQADVDAGTVSYTADATGMPPAGADVVRSSPVTLDLPIRHEPALTLVKSADKQGLVVGDLVTFSYVVTNTGNVTLAPVTLTLVDFSGAAVPSEITCPAEAAALAPGAQMICTATYVVQQDDVDAGQLLSTATATGAPLHDDPVVTPLAEAQLAQEAVPSLTLVKTADLEKIYAVGDVVTYSFLVTNTGNVSVSDVMIDEVAFSGSGTLSAVQCPADVNVLIPGQRMTCTATYAATGADLGAGTVSNSATAKGVSAGAAAEVVSESSTAEVETVALPTATLASTGSNIASGALLALGMFIGLGSLFVMIARPRQKRSN